MDTTQLPHSAKAKGPPAARACHPHAERRNCNFGVHQPPINPQTTPKGPPPTPLHSQPKRFTAAMDHLSFDLRAPRARPRFKISRRNEFFTISGNRGAAKANELLPTPRPISQPPTNIVSARPSPPWAPEQPAPPQNAQISRSAVLPTTKHAPYLNCPGANRGWTVADF